jgi:hypothetical protein
MADTIARAEMKFPIDIPPNEAHTFGNVAGNITGIIPGSIASFPCHILFPLPSTIVVPLNHLPGG